ncbi:MAG: GLUG domain protein [halophilic archaeon J07HX64]|nr:MAG: GLUG domain protein [halophilic archaeon J07HX64]
MSSANDSASGTFTLLSRGDITAPDCGNVTYRGDGTASDPHEVRTVDQLQCLAVNNRTAVYEQAADIDTTGTDRWNDGGGFTPIEPPDIGLDDFAGEFHGNGYEIIGLTINRSAARYIGMFVDISDTGVLTDLTLTDASVTGLEEVGGIAYRNRGEIRNASVSGQFSAEEPGAGSIVGSNTGLIENTSATGRVSGPGSGGLVGSNTLTGVIRHSEAHVRVHGNGGLAGDSFSGEIIDSHATGRVTGSTAVGGLTGLIGDGSVIKGSYATGRVNGDKRVGGLIGSVDVNGTVTESYATGDVDGIESVGGLVGWNRGGNSCRVVRDRYCQYYRRVCWRARRIRPERNGS